MNPDEGWWPAGALKATADLVPWRGFDSYHERARKSVYVLTLPALLGARISFFATRVVGIFLLTGTVSGSLLRG